MKTINIFPSVSLDMSEFRQIFSQAKHIAIITGAGVSAESGVPTFRGENEKWRKWQSQVLGRKVHTWVLVFGLFSAVVQSCCCGVGVFYPCIIHLHRLMDLTRQQQPVKREMVFVA